MLFHKYKFYEKFGFQDDNQTEAINLDQINKEIDLRNIKMQILEEKKILSEEAVHFIENEWTIQKEKIQKFITELYLI